jgi:NAD(P)-dependent dehydrogenase (short-subunit alcohol dehydrogenase family)
LAVVDHSLFISMARERARQSVAETALPAERKKNEMTTPFVLEGQCAIVTGASSGIGRHMALTLARAGAKVAAGGRRIDRLEALVGEIEGFDGRAIPLSLDVRDAQSVAAAIEAAETELGPIGILVNGAGVALTKPFLETEEGEWNLVLDTNLKGAYLTSREVARHMVRLGHPGCIVNIASIFGFRVQTNLSAYTVSKAALVQLTRAMALELAAHGIRVNAIAPGYVETDMNAEFLESDVGQRMAQRIPQKRFGTFEDLDGALMLLVSDASRHMTGSVLTVDGGHLLRM